MNIPSNPGGGGGNGGMVPYRPDPSESPSSWSTCNSLYTRNPKTRLNIHKVPAISEANMIPTLSLNLKFVNVTINEVV